MRFIDIEGQAVTANHLTEIIDSGRISHAQMFLGDTVYGSLALAIAYAQYLNCEHREHYDNVDEHGGLRADSCGKCPQCMKYEQLSHSDLHLFFPTTTTASEKSKPCAAMFQKEFREFLASKKQRGTLDDWYDFLGVDNKQGLIRELDSDEIVKQLNLKSYEGFYKVVILWMAEKMNAVTANKILKSLEEPESNTLIILVVENSEKMLSTIISRTQLVRIPRVSTGDSFMAGDIVLRHETQTEFGKLYVTWMRQLFKLNMASLSSWVEEVSAMGREMQKQFLLYSQESIRECFMCNNAGVPLLIDFGDEKFNKSFPAMITERNIEGLNEAFDNTIYAIERNAYAKIALMELSFKISKWLKKR